MTDPYPNLTPTTRNADPRCGSQPAPNAPTCGQPATWHVAWRLTPGDAHFSLMCDRHMEQASRELVYVDRHEAEVACDMPGTGWLLATPSRCVAATTEDATALSAAVQPTAERAEALLATVLATFPDSGPDGPAIRSRPLPAGLVHRWKQQAGGGTGGHLYLSTGCLHGDQGLPDGRTGHEYCQSATGKGGAKRPAQCKFCAAPCICACHHLKEK
ncbi:hypothetical protein QFZ63_001591 [Streptomyces sp. B3I7]|uniref:hypothetical protein n=1 Tax=Streptomyces sp. B3I7 TaxID=3042269 RepID=UPI0027898C4D|nr:hypothetical protein [Streptomyces sp. B3I7]MDQ0809877.1 hypothetical protein [Streptomyces sp. B3I7]